jgi:hypothetical protein
MTMRLVGGGTPSTPPSSRNAKVNAVLAPSVSGRKEGWTVASISARAEAAGTAIQQQLANAAGHRSVRFQLTFEVPVGRGPALA